MMFSYIYLTDNQKTTQYEGRYVLSPIVLVILDGEPT